MTGIDRPKMLMCPPDHFSVDYVINPWMAGNEGAPDQDRTRIQWDAPDEGRPMRGESQCANLRARLR